MKIGYPGFNREMDCRPSSTFRLRSLSRERFLSTVTSNLDCLGKILRFNAANGILFFRITSDLIPFASHPQCPLPWRAIFEEKFRELGKYIKHRGVRISMHPDQFTLINSPDREIFERSTRELLYHADVLDALELDGTAKIQIHVGGVYGDKTASMKRFAERFCVLPERISRRLAIENDDRSYMVRDCSAVHEDTGVPILFDSFHHALNNNGESVREAFARCSGTWKKKDGLPMVDYSSQRPGARRGSHAETIDDGNFRSFLSDIKGYDCDIMLEIKDKEKSALRALSILPTRA